MPRIACLFVPGFPLAALRRAEPELRGESVAVAERKDPRARILAASPEAAARGVRRDLTVAQARALAASLTVRTVSDDLLGAATGAILDVAESFSPRVERDDEPGVVFLDVDGLGSLFESEHDLGALLAARCHRAGLGARIGIASSKIAARLAARRGRGIEILDAERERSWIAALPIRLLAPPPNLAETLDRWGIGTIGDLARLPLRTVGPRLGGDIVRLWHQAHGEDDSPLRPEPRPVRFEEAQDCEYAIDRFEPLSFLLRAALERLVSRLRLRGFRAGDLELDLSTADRGRECRTVRVAAPTNDVKGLLAFLQGSFESHPPRGAIESFRLAARPEPVRAEELDLFAPTGPSPEDLDTTWARIAALIGPDRIGHPSIVDSWHPERFENGNAKPAPRGNAPSAAPVVSILALRAFRPPVLLAVHDARGGPDLVRARTPVNGGPRPDGRIVTLSGPWRLRGEWWRDAPLERDYYDAELTDGCVYRIYRERPTGEWFAAGVYD